MSEEQVGDRILRVALEHLIDRGYGRLSMEGVAADAGVAKTTVYRRYRNRADLATAAIAADVTVLPDPAAADDVRAALVAFLTTFGTRWEQVGLDVLGAMLIEREDSELLELHRERIITPRRAYALALMELAVERGEVRSDIDPVLALEAMIGSFMARHVSGGEGPPEEWARAIVDLVWNGIKTP